MFHIFLYKWSFVRAVIKFFIMWLLLLQIFLLSENINTEFLNTYYKNSDYTNIITFKKITSNLTQNR